MPSVLKRLRRRLKIAEAELDSLQTIWRDSRPKPWSFPTDPVGYAKAILGVSLTGPQQEVAMSLLAPPRKTMVDSAHNVGKTFLGAVLTNWWYDSFDGVHREPGVAITTAPTERDVIDLLWAEVRQLRQRAGLSNDFIGPAAPCMRTSDAHYAKGYTARKGESFQGRHRERMLFVFDEAEGIDPGYWTTVKSMFKPEYGHAWLAIGNPTTTTSQAYLEQASVDGHGNPSWRLFNLSALDHPNIAAELTGLAPPIPTAVTLGQLEQWIADWCDPINAGEQDATDIEWPPNSGKWYRPGPIGEARILGRRPSAGTYGVWSDRLWGCAEAARLRPGLHELPEIGVDVARYGDDYTVFHVRCGPCSFHHERHNGWGVDKSIAGLKLLAAEWAAKASEFREASARTIEPTEILLKIDDDGVGGGVVDPLKADGYAVIRVGAGTRARREDRYPNRRSELWFDLADRARRASVDFSRLPGHLRAIMKRQAMAPEWLPDGSGRRVVERKDVTKAKIGESPDDMDAANLAYYEGIPFIRPTPIDTPERSLEPVRESAQQRRHMFGRK